MNENHIPVLVACGQVTNRNDDTFEQTPVTMMVEAARLAEKDSGSNSLLESVDTIAAVGLTVDAGHPPNPLAGLFDNLPQTLANELGVDLKRGFYSATGGNTPQMLVNRFSEEIAQGKSQCVLLAGGEALKTMINRGMQGLPFDQWMDSPGGTPEAIGDDRLRCTDHEAEYGFQTPANVYPLFENALRVHYQRGHDEHMEKIGSMYSRYTQVAARNENAWFPIERSSEELITVNENNRMICWPYPKMLNSIIKINQSAAVILTSLAHAKKLSIPQEKWVFLHGCADAADIWNVTERVNYYSSPCLNRIGKEALKMANLSIDEIQHLDIYSCFPSAVQIACDELGIAHDDPRELTVTGGLPYFGGPGNNYSMHAIAEMMNTLRSNPGDYGLLNANGWFVTKHSIGIYSTTPLKEPWQRPDSASYQAEILEQKGPSFVQHANGPATIETYTVLFNRVGPEESIVIGRLDNGERFLATTSSEPADLEQLLESEAIGRHGTVENVNGRNIFSLT